MMQAFLMNFGDNTRVVNNSQNIPVAIAIGEIVETDIHDVHFAMIRRAVATETLFVVPKDVRKTERLGAVMKLMADMMTEPYDDVLARYNVLGDEDPENIKLRPTRDEMRMKLRDIARFEVARAVKMQSKVVIHEQGDATTRQEVTRTDKPDGALTTLIPEVKEPPAPAPKKKAKTKAKKPVVKTRKRERL